MSGNDERPMKKENKWIYYDNDDEMREWEMAIAEKIHRHLTAYIQIIKRDRTLDGLLNERK
jgi:hypothetical protein